MLRRFFKIFFLLPTIPQCTPVVATVATFGTLCVHKHECTVHPQSNNVHLLCSITSR